MNFSFTPNFNVPKAMNLLPLKMSTFIRAHAMVSIFSKNITQDKVIEDKKAAYQIVGTDTRERI